MEQHILTFNEKVIDQQEKINWTNISLENTNTDNNEMSKWYNFTTTTNINK